MRQADRDRTHNALGTVPFDGIASVAVVTGEQGVELAGQRAGDQVTVQQGADRTREPVATDGRVAADPVVAAEQEVQAVLVAESERELAAELALAAGRLRAEFGRTAVAQDKALGLRRGAGLGGGRVAGAAAAQQELGACQITGPRVLTDGCGGTGWIGLSRERRPGGSGRAAG